MIEQLIADFEQHANPEKSKQMAAYMKDHFEFFGLQTPLRRQLSRPFIKEHRTAIDWEIIFELWQQPQRELQYVAVDLLISQKNQLQINDAVNLKKLVQTKSWWDTIDGLDELLGAIVLNQGERGRALALSWSLDENFWVRRMAIDHQLQFKNQTDTSLLSQVISNNFGSDEFFINKAIGWALREYSKTDPKWVSEFVLDNQDQMDKLSIREASKYLD